MNPVMMWIDFLAQRVNMWNVDAIMLLVLPYCCNAGDVLKIISKYMFFDLLIGILLSAGCSSLVLGDLSSIAGGGGGGRGRRWSRG